MIRFGPAMKKNLIPTFGRCFLLTNYLNVGSKLLAINQLSHDYKLSLIISFVSCFLIFLNAHAWFLETVRLQMLVYVYVSVPRALITSHVKSMHNNQIKQFYSLFISLYDVCHQ